MPTLVTVPATTGPKSHATGPEAALIVLLGGLAVSVETAHRSCNVSSARTKTYTTARTVIRRRDRTRRVGIIQRAFFPKRRIVPPRMGFQRFGRECFLRNLKTTPCWFCYVVSEKKGS